MTVQTPTSDDDNEAVKAAEEIINSEAEQVNVEGVFSLAVRVGVMLNNWRKLMVEGGFSEEWVQDASMTIFHKFFNPWYPPYGEDDDDDDNHRH